MKKLLFTIGFLLFASVSFASPNMMAGVIASAPPSGGGGGNIAEYFGNNTTSGTFTAIGNSILYNTGATFTCPGTGTRTIDELAFYGRTTSGTAYYLMAFGTNASPSTILFKSSAPIGDSTSTGHWMTSTSFTGTAQCTGGTTYKIFVAGDMTTTEGAYGGASTGQYGRDHSGGTAIVGGTFGATQSVTGDDTLVDIFLRAHVMAGP